MTPVQSILVIEDDLAQQSLAKMVLSTLAETVDIVGNGAAALEQLKKHTYDVIVLDLGLPDMSGLDVARSYRKMDKESTTPILIVSAHKMSDTERQNALNAGVDECASKPINSEKLQLIWPSHNLK